MRPPLMWALAAALGMTAWMSFQSDDATVEPVKQGARSSKPAESRVASSAPKPRLVPEKASPVPGLLSRLEAWKGREAVGLKPESKLKPWLSSLPPPPPPPPQVKVAEAPPPPPPQAPKFPHAWVGRFNDMAVISGPQRTWVAAAGQVIDGRWRVDQIQERQLQLTYLPYQQVQTVAMQTP